MPVADRGQHQSGAPEDGILLVMVPGMGIAAADFDTEGLIGAVAQRHCSVKTATVDPGPDSYLDGSVETRLLDGIGQARHKAGPNRIWLAGISLGCQAILRCVRANPDLAEGLILLTPYLANTGLIAEVVKAGGLHSWAASRSTGDNPERALLTWLATASPSSLPKILIGRARADRFVSTATLLADRLPPDQVVSVPGGHDWESWRALWHLILDQNPFERGPFGHLAPAPV